MRLSLAALAVLVLLSGLTGCGRLLGSRYENFTAYYNTFYNAREAFEREEEALLTQERPVDRSRFLTIFVEPPEQGGRQGGFEEAVEKGANLLRDHPTSKWVDDALLLIGKAYFYQSNFAGAEQKFREVLALEEDALADEAQLWLGRTLIASGSYDEAALVLRDGLDRAGLRERWAGPMRLALAEVDVRRGEYEAATVALQEGLRGLRDKDLAARGAFLLGQVYDALDRPDDAADAYAQVLGYGPSYELAYAAQLSQALALARGAEPERGLALLDRMRRDDKNFQSLAEVELTRAHALALAGYPEEARSLLRTLLYDPDPALQVGALRGQMHYYLGEVYREGLEDYARAAAHYDTAATALRAPVEPGARVTRYAITDAPRRASTFGSYARVAREIAEMDSLLYLGSLDDDAFAEAIEAVRAQRRREADERQRDLARRRAEQGFGTGPQTADGRGQTDAGAGTPAPGPQGAGFLSFRNPVRVQEQLIGFQARWGERPLVPNWRRAAAIGGEQEVREDLADLVEDVPGLQTPSVLSDELVDVSAIPRDPIAQQRMIADRAAARYELGNVLFLALDEPDAAVAWYRQVIEENPESAVAPRAYFALAEAQRALGNEAEANDLYQQVLDRFPESDFVDQVRERLGMAPRVDAVEADSLATAEAEYALAYERWQAGHYAEALDAMLSVSERYPTTPVAARARLAAGTLYTEWAAGDSTLLLDPLPHLSAAPSDSAGAPVVAPADSALADSALVPAADAFDDPWLYALYASIEEDYPGTPYAERARAIRTALAERYPAPPPPPVPAADSLDASPTPADTSEQVLVQAGPRDVPDLHNLIGTDGLSARQGGVSWVVFSTDDRALADSVVSALADLEYRTALYVERGSPSPFHVLVGQFREEVEAELVREGLPTVRGGAAPRLLSLEGKEIEGAGTLSRRNDQ